MTQLVNNPDVSIATEAASRHPVSYAGQLRANVSKHKPNYVEHNAKKLKQKPNMLLTEPNSSE